WAHRIPRRVLAQAGPAPVQCARWDFSHSTARARPTAPTPVAGAHCPHRRRNSMIDLNHIDDLARRLSELVPPGLRDSGEELQAGLSRLDLVTREEFDVQRAVLLRTREKLHGLEQAVEQLEARLAAAGGNSSQPH